MAANTRDVTSADFVAQVVERSHQVPVVVDFWAAWCGPCRVLGPTLERLAEEGGGSWELAKVDVDQNQQLAMQFGVQGIPTVVAFKDGKAVSRFSGALPEPQVRAFLSQLLPSQLDLIAAQGEAALERGDEDAAEKVFRRVLEQDPSHEDAGLGLAGLLLERGEHEEALAVLARLAPTEAVRRLQAAARLGSGEADGDDPVAAARAMAAAGRTEEALDRLLEVVAERDGERSEEARQVVLDLFEVLGPEEPLTVAYRRKLANALF